MPLYEHEYTAINAMLSHSGAFVLMLTPRDTAARKVLQQIIDDGPASLTWHYRGPNQDSLDSGQLTSVFFACGGTRYFRQTGRTDTIDYEGAIKIRLDLPSGTDHDALDLLQTYGTFTGVSVDPQSTANAVRLLPTRSNDRATTDRLSACS